ncbi:hypothetical protein [Chondromyces apiculatus]|uniref:Uncharacterized protein n=1 Tax=Chondromyces apiculatus DSM 436 TaxID=1192034 RepID=A0A017TEV3_9BACT|nr:hypothetical protein [Chondromyces apiculatus]EYF07101.1 Hypothetical protein CAP_0580 [Chondromyces apiculatus DSM 436]
MIQFFNEGGWAMWPILVFGMLTIGAAARFAQSPERAHLRFIGTAGVLTAVTTFHATWLCIGSVMAYVSDLEGAAPARVSQILFAGLKESTSPGALGGALLVMACLLVAFGTLRQDKMARAAVTAA